MAQPAVDLPVELWTKILKDSSKDTLPNASLVCTIANKAATTLLYANFDGPNGVNNSLNNIRRIGLFSRTVSRSPDLAALVKSVTFFEPHAVVDESVELTSYRKRKLNASRKGLAEGFKIFLPDVTYQERLSMDKHGFSLLAERHPREKWRGQKRTNPVTFCMEYAPTVKILLTILPSLKSVKLSALDIGKALGQSHSLLLSSPGLALEHLQISRSDSYVAVYASKYLKCLLLPSFKTLVTEEILFNISAASIQENGVFCHASNIELVGCGGDLGFFLGICKSLVVLKIDGKLVSK